MMRHFGFLNDATNEIESVLMCQNVLLLLQLLIYCVLSFLILCYENLVSILLSKSLILFK